MDNNPINEITGVILDASVAVHKLMGPGLLESVYELCLMKELQLRGLDVQRQVSIPLVYKGFELCPAMHALKSVTHFSEQSQISTYLSSKMASGGS